MKVVFRVDNVEGTPENCFNILDGNNSDINKIVEVVATNIGFVNDKSSDFAKGHNLTSEELKKFVRYLCNRGTEIIADNKEDFLVKLDSEFNKFQKSLYNNAQVIDGGNSLPKGIRPNDYKKPSLTVVREPTPTDGHRGR